MPIEMNRTDFFCGRLKNAYERLKRDIKLQPMTVEISISLKDACPSADRVIIGTFERQELPRAAQIIANLGQPVVDLEIKTFRKDCRGYNALRIGFEEPV